jgi:hypothetical protein
VLVERRIENVGELDEPALVGLHDAEECPLESKLGGSFLRNSAWG